MNKTLIAAALAATCAAPLHAAPATVGLGTQLGYYGNDAGSGADFDGSVLWDLFGQARINNHLALEAGYAYASAAEDKGEDNQGSWQLKLTNNDFYGGLRLQSQAMGPWSFYGRGGLLYYRSKIEFSEAFFGLKPAGKLEEIEEGTGWYLGAGASVKVAPHLLLDMGLGYRQRLDYFEDSRKPFDMNQFGGSVGLLWLLP